jgi:hypothetical protein
MDISGTPSREGTSILRPEALDASALLRRHAVASALSAAGYPVSATTLATQASRGGGPPYRLFGRIPLYRWGDALSWAEGRCTSLRHSTSEARAK